MLVNLVFQDMFLIPHDSYIMCALIDLLID